MKFIACRDCIKDINDLACQAERAAGKGNLKNPYMVAKKLAGKFL